ncbi:hypothetical protein, partial [Aeromonas caviae]|nr:hypothetical protein KAM335_41730 [Aeromonas caviae]GJA25832.1 hypothetical protein KAM337_43600 [Aeromonas caviae]GJA88050.1 hypothetical protein KAM356_41090 [Aeromonas caviae]GJA92166.1 hypothetical protein KAM357_41140 [Aeromonas caviae]GJB09438.1 hypothetical protein KAM361_41110 [Aeromonas caviae]
MPSEPSVIRFYVALLAAMGAPLRPRPRLPEMEQLALAGFDHVSKPWRTPPTCCSPLKTLRNVDR